MSHLYLLIPRIRVEAANALSCSWVINAAPVNAALLFGHALGRELQEDALGVAYIHHDAQHLGERIKYGDYAPQQRRGASFINKDDYASGSHSLSLQPTASVHLTVSLIIAFDEDAEIAVADLERLLLGRRFAGGRVVEYGQPALYDDVALLNKRVPSGFWVIDRSDLLQSEQQTPTQRLIDLCGAAHSSERVPWLVPTVLGYLTLTAPTTKSGVREGYEHSYAEPVVGLVQYFSTSQARQVGTSIPFWDFHWPNSETYLLQHVEL